MEWSSRSSDYEEGRSGSCKETSDSQKEFNLYIGNDNRKHEEKETRMDDCESISSSSSHYEEDFRRDRPTRRYDNSYNTKPPNKAERKLNRERKISLLGSPYEYLSAKNAEKIRERMKMKKLISDKKNN